MKTLTEPFKMLDRFFLSCLKMGIDEIFRIWRVIWAKKNNQKCSAAPCCLCSFSSIDQPKCRYKNEGPKGLKEFRHTSNSLAQDHIVVTGWPGAERLLNLKLVVHSLLTPSLTHSTVLWVPINGLNIVLIPVKVAKQYHR